MQDYPEKEEDIFKNEIKSQNNILLFEPPLKECEKQELKIPLPINQINQEYFINKLKNMKKNTKKTKKANKDKYIDSSPLPKNIQLFQKDN